MSANPHNQAAVAAMGNKFKTNVFDTMHSGLQKGLQKSILNDRRTSAVPGTGGPARTTGTTTNFRAKPGNGTPRAAIAPPRTPATGAHTYGFRSGPTGVGPSTTRAITSGPGPQQGHITRLDQTGAHAMTPVRSGLPGGAYNRPALPSGHRGTTPVAMGSGSSGGTVSPQQFANVTPRDNSPYPTHQHPAGSSHALLPTLTANQPAPNQFTVGSRRSTSGIAAAGSRLEAWGQARQGAAQARTASRRAGGRDRGLAAEANRAENFANQPLRNFAP